MGDISTYKFLLQDGYGAMWPLDSILQHAEVAESKGLDIDHCARGFVIVNHASLTAMVRVHTDHDLDCIDLTQIWRGVLQETGLDIERDDVRQVVGSSSSSVRKALQDVRSLT